jgi:hypothetical protein
MTDRAIVRTGMRAIGVEPTEALIDEVLVDYLLVLADEVAAAPDATYRIHAAWPRPWSGRGPGGTWPWGWAPATSGRGRASSSSESASTIVRLRGLRVQTTSTAPPSSAAAPKRGGQRCWRAARGMPGGGHRRHAQGRRGRAGHRRRVRRRRHGSFTPEQLVAAGATRAFATLAVPEAMEAVLGALR